MLRIVTTGLLIAGLVGTSVAASTDEAGTKQPEAKTQAGVGATDYFANDDPAQPVAEIGAKPTGWFARINPFSPISQPESPAPAVASDPSATTVPPEGPRAEGSQNVAPLPVEGPEAERVMPRLNGILFTARMPIAIIDDTLVRVGDQIGSLRVVSISRDTVNAEEDSVCYVMTTRRPVAQIRVAPKPAPKEDAGSDGQQGRGETQSSHPAERADNPGADSGQLGFSLAWPFAAPSSTKNGMNE